MNWLSPYDFDYSIRAGVEATRFPLAWNGQNLSFCTLLCYEDSDFAQTRWAMNSAPPPDFWVNQSNDGWFQGTEEHAQHLATARFRTIETRRSMARAVNSGISALIDPLGRILAPSPIEGNIWRANPSAAEVPHETWDRFKAMDMVLVGELPLCSAKAPYLNLGDWVAWLCIVLVGAGLFIRPRYARPT
jgi:apolipoprotein N-acyltransferase